jgi:hypothetical protein
MINEILPRYLATTAADIQAVCREVFTADNRVILTYVPVAASDEQPSAEQPSPEESGAEESGAEESGAEPGAA